MKRATAFATLFLTLVLIGLGGLAALALDVPWAFSTGSASPASSLECSVKTSCNYAVEVEVLRMSSTSNAHAGTLGGSTYGHSLCCTKLTGLGTQCAATTHAVVLGLSATDNAHAASDGSYATEVCLSAEGDDATVDCTYGATCDVDYACLATISGSTNAHVADCNGVDDYATKVCCQVTPDNCPAVPNPGQENNDGDEWGNACDNCPDIATLWFAPVGDDDCDGFTTATEEHVGTDPTDGCTDEAGDLDAWPPDINVDGVVDIFDAGTFLAAFPSVEGSPNYSQRLDFSPDWGVIDIFDAGTFLAFFPGACANP